MFLGSKLLLVFIFISASSSICFSINQEHQRFQRFGIMQQSSEIEPTRHHSGRHRVVNVDDFGAEGDGRDDSGAFLEAWQDACSSTRRSVIVVPRDGVYHLKPTTFSGPCNNDLKLKIHGTIKASLDKSDYNRDRRHWLVFQNVQDFKVKGGGIINGNGMVWWKTSCKRNKSLPCTDAPTAVTFMGCNKVTVADIWFQNAQKMHLTFQKCTNVKAMDLVITAPRKSPNTDGIHITETQNVKIMNSIIRTGDDCISMVSGSKNIRATDIFCGPGHGISIGSLGSKNSSAYVSDVLVNRATLSDTTNGLRIKTWQGGSGYAKNIKFQNVLMHNVSNPIIIDQYYCDREEACPEQYSAVQVSNVVYKSISGTSATDVATKFNCSKSFPCQGVYLQDINLKREGDESAGASCVNVMLATRGEVSPKCS